MQSDMDNIFIFFSVPSESQVAENNNASFSLLLPGKVLYFNALNELRKFRGRGNKEGAKRAWQYLQEAGLGTFKTQKAARGTAQVILLIHFICNVNIAYS